MASAGLDQNVTVSSTVTLDGSASTAPDGGLLSYFWGIVSKPEGSQAALSDPTAVKPTFVPDLGGTYIFSLVVTSGAKESFESFVTVTAATGNSAPIANAGADQNVVTGSLVTLDGSGSSDADGDPLTYSWSFVSQPAGSAAAFNDATVAKPTFTVDLDGHYVLSLIVNDSLVDSQAAAVTITASTLNSAPVANAGPDQNVATGSLIALDGSGSSDADGDLLTYSWAFTSRPSGSTATLSDPTAANPTFSADLDGTYVLTLIVNDGLVNSQPDSITITAETLNSAPVANAGPDQNVVTGSVVTLSGSGSSDADDDLLTYSWEFVSKPSDSVAILENDTDVSPSFLADVEGIYVIGLIVDDGFVGSNEDRVVVTATSNYTTLFSKSVTSSTSKFNNFYQAGSRFGLTINNIGNIPFRCDRAELYSGTSVIGFTEDQSLLGNGQVDPGESINIMFTLKTSVQDNGFQFRYYLTRQDTGETFIIVHSFF